MITSYDIVIVLAPCHTTFMKHILLGTFASLTFLSPVRANDSEAAVPVGGLTLIRSDNISMDSEDLFLSEEQVRVQYRFTNQGTKDIETLIAFPLPDYPAQEEYFSNEYSLTLNPKDLNFKTFVDGKQVALSIEHVGKIKGKSINAALKKYGLPVDWMFDESYEAKLKALTKKQASQAVKEGLLTRSGEADFFANWSITSHFTRKQIFPAGKTIGVSHSYTPSVGGSVGGGIENAPADYATEYCTDASFMAGFKKKLNAHTNKLDEKLMHYSETWLQYVLSSGANWKGPIKDFRLVVDKGSAKNMVSFCMDGVKKISPTQFEVRKTNFEPNKDLNILIVNWMMPD